MSLHHIKTAVSAQLLVYNNIIIQVIVILELLELMLEIYQRQPAVVIITIWLISRFTFVLDFLLCKGTTVSVKLAGWDNAVSKKRMSASPVRAKMVAPVWTDIMATPVSANLDSEVIKRVTSA